MTRDSALIRHFGLRDRTPYWGPAHRKYAKRILEAVESRRLVAVQGHFGTGKSTLVDEALYGIDNLQLVSVNPPDKERLGIGGIMEVMVRDLSEEPAKMSMVRRTNQLSRIVAHSVFSRKKEVVVVIDNADRLHARTLLAIKDMRESLIKRRREGFLFTVVLIGQPGLASKVNAYGEVGLRTKLIDLDSSDEWMSLDDRVGYLTHVYGDVIQEEARRMLAAVLATPLSIDEFMEERLGEMRDAGLRRFTTDMLPADARSLRKLMNLSLADVARMTGVPKSTVADIEQGRSKKKEAADRVMASLTSEMKRRAV